MGQLTPRNNCQMSLSLCDKNHLTLRKISHNTRAMPSGDDLDLYDPQHDVYHTTSFQPEKIWIYALSNSKFDLGYARIKELASKKAVMVTLSLSSGAHLQRISGQVQGREPHPGRRKRLSTSRRSFHAPQENSQGLHQVSGMSSKPTSMKRIKWFQLSNSM